MDVDTLISLSSTNGKFIACNSAIRLLHPMQMYPNFWKLIDLCEKVEAEERRAEQSGSGQGGRGQGYKGTRGEGEKESREEGERT